MYFQLDYSKALIRFQLGEESKIGMQLLIAEIWSVKRQIMAKGMLSVSQIKTEPPKPATLFFVNILLPQHPLLLQ